jgi:cytochrome c556
MENTSPEKTKTSVGIKIAGGFGLVVLAVAFFAFPLITLARGQGNDLRIPGLGAFPFNNGPLQNILQNCGNQGNDSSDANNNCSPFDAKAFHQQLQKFLAGICLDTGNNIGNSSDANNNGCTSPFDAKAFHQQLQKFLDSICGDIGTNNCGSNTGNTIKQSPITFKLVGVFEQSGKPLGFKGTSRPTIANAPITIVKVKSLQALQTGFIVAAKDAKGNTFTGRIISPNQSPVKRATGLINGQGALQTVTIAL